MSEATFKQFNVLRRPVVTEKSYGAISANNQYTFRVAKEATKADVKASIEAVFDVKVEKVQVISIPSKEKRRGVHAGYRPGYRKAVVRLAEGHTLEVAEEV